MNFRYILKKFDSPVSSPQEKASDKLANGMKFDRFYHSTYKTMLYKYSHIIRRNKWGGFDLTHRNGMGVTAPKKTNVFLRHENCE